MPPTHPLTQFILNHRAPEALPAAAQWGGRFAGAGLF